MDTSKKEKVKHSLALLRQILVSGELGRMFGAVGVLRAEWPEMPMQTAATFLAVATAKDETILMTDLLTIVGLPQSTLSKNVAYLCEWRKHEVPGMNVVETFPDPMNRRQKLVRLTPKGRLIASKITAAIKGQPV